ncbi:MAG: ABC transporter ATP-binding protein [Lachnospiraceae bacterium]|nr:ABC transporter ATP-binding protein [Lachnospiraceae bacterium]
MAVALKIENLCKTYIVNKRQNNGLKNVNFTVNEGEMTAIMGPSGSGKSTLLYAVSGMDTITSGKVCFFEKDIDKMSEKELANLRLDDMGFIFQQMYMMKNLTVLDNIVLPACQSGKIMESRKETIQRGIDLMRRLDIIEIADNDINEVSGGQLQRACICRSLINKPKMIFADEPTGALNRSASEEVMEELVRINKEGTTIMLVTHDVKVAAKCKKVLYIVDGNIKGEYNLEENIGQIQSADSNEEKRLRRRERELSNWLMDMGW